MGHFAVPMAPLITSSMAQHPPLTPVSLLFLHWHQILTCCGCGPPGPTLVYDALICHLDGKLTPHPAHSFRAHCVPGVLHVIQIFGTHQACDCRCSMPTEFRQF